MEALLTCKNLNIEYEGRTAVQDVSFELYPGEYIYIVGENGSGKSTLLKAILGLIPKKSGEIIFGGGLTRRGIGYLPQQTGIQRDFPARVGEVVISGRLGVLGRRPFFCEKDRVEADKNMEELHILDLKRRSYRELSGGQQQRALLARALCATDRLLLLDEPVSGLDPIATAEMYSVIRELNRSRGVAIVMVSHDISSALGNAEKILHLDSSVEFFGTSEDYAQSDIGKRFFGGDGHA